MKRRILLSIAIAVLTTLFVQPVCHAQDTDRQAEIYINGVKATPTKAEFWRTTPESSGKYTIGGLSPIAMAIQFEGDTDILRVHPAVVDILFGNTGGNTKFFNATGIDGKNADVKGLKAGDPVTVYDMSGKQCLSTVAGANGTVIATESLPKGTYVIRSGDVAIKFVKR